VASDQLSGDADHEVNTSSTVEPAGQPIARFRSVTKRYRGVRQSSTNAPALSGLILDVLPGRTTAVLGPNGSGKTTMFRLLLGFTRPTEGTVELFGRPVVDGLRHGRGVGAVIETPRFPPRLTGRRALELLAGVRSLPRTRIEEVLDQVQLTDAARSRVGTYSLGMRQRLGIAAALLPEPSVLILDEPSNGLDPTGNAELRTLLHTFVRDGGTVILSSHALVEVEHLADDVVILDRGVCHYAGAMNGFGGKTEPWWRVNAETINGPLNPDQLANVLGPLVAEAHVEPLGGARVRMAGKAAELTRRLANQGVWVTELTPRSPTLEEQYLQWFGTRTGLQDHDVTMTPTGNPSNGTGNRNVEPDSAVAASERGG